MILINEEIINFEELELPETVYKYRSWSNKFHQTILSHYEVYFAPPSSFEDPNDCKIPVRWDLLTEKEIYEKYFLDATENHPEWSRQQKRKFARDWTKSSPIKNKLNLKKHTEDQVLQFDQRFGVLSLTANPGSNDMWEKYSNEHKGFCVGFDPNIMFKFFGGGGQVLYDDELPEIHPMPKHSFVEQNHLQVFSKEEKWKFEQEYRVFKFNKEPFKKRERVIKIPVEAFKEVIFGSNMSNSDKEEILGVIRNHLSHIEIKEAIINEGKIVIKK